MDYKVDLLFDSVMSLDSKQECKEFFEELCTSQELKALAQRLAVAKMLHDGKVYSEIVAETGASTAIVSRVKRSMGRGYEAVFEKGRS